MASSLIESEGFLTKLEDRFIRAGQSKPPFPQEASQHTKNKGNDEASEEGLASR